MTANVEGAETEALDFISTLVYERSRIRLDRGKHELIKARLGKRMRQHGFAALPEYCRFLQTSAPSEEVTKVIDALTTNFTSFMREPDHFDFLVRTAALEAAARHGLVRIWSAACSSGEEPYTIGFFMDHLQRQRMQIGYEITASDISTKVLEQAASGIYAADRVTTLPPEWLPRYFQKGNGNWKNQFRVKEPIREKIAFRQINLSADYSHLNPFDVIFCRNVMIYFDRATQEEIVNRMCRYLSRSGYLIIGHSESLNGLKVPLQCIRPSIYQKQ